MAGVPGICDRCGQRYPLKSLKPEYVLGRPTGFRTCPSCHDTSHPQLDTRGVDASDKQRVDDSRSDAAELSDSRRMFGFDPVGGAGTGVVAVFGGVVSVEVGS